jgi:2-keto-4-pentenoate hydratase/2-oxohepta-3-ene-1,7-dioic acid hydratase in catechol pathway
MKFRRIRSPDGSSIVRQAQQLDGEWKIIESSPSAFKPEWELESADRLGLSPSVHLLPIQPLSFRDFMLFERHAVDAARGYAKRFMPGAYRLARGYEWLSGTTFPPFKPAPLWFRQPIYYMGNHLAFAPSGAPVQTPSYSAALDYELELGFVLARPLFNASPEEAAQAIGAFVVLNDFSARDVQLSEMRSGFGPQKSKHFLSSMSDTAVTADEILPRLQDIVASVRINDRLVSTPNLKGMRYTLGEALAHVSREEHLFAGELFGTGTLPGGSGMETGCWLKSGDRLSLAIDGVGEIHHDIL